MSNFDEFIKKYDRDIKKLYEKIKKLENKFNEMGFEDESVMGVVTELDNRVIKLEKIHGIKYNKDEQDSQIETRSKAKKMKNIKEEIPVKRQNSHDSDIFETLESKVDEKEDSKGSKKKGRKQKGKKSNTNRMKRENKENSIFKNEIDGNNINNIDNDNNEIIQDNNINNINNDNNENKELIDNNNINNINSNYDICTFGNNEFDINSSVLSTSDKASVFSFKNQFINKNNNTQNNNEPKIIENYIPIELNKNKYINYQKNKNNNIYNHNFKETDLEKIITSNIIKNVNEINLILTSLTSYNKFDGLPQFQAIFQSALDGDSAKKFHKFCDGEPNLIVVIESKNGNRFGGYTKKGFSSDGDIKCDNSSFLFSLDKMKIYRVKKNAKAIFCNPDYGPCFGDNDYKGLQINDNYLSQNSYVGKANGLFLYMNQDYELNQGTKEFQVDKLEIFKILV